MKKILFTILFLTSLTALSAQLQDSFLLVGSAGTFSTVNDSTFRGTVTFQTDQFGSGYLPTGIQANYKLIDAKGDIFTVTVVNSSNFTTANIDVEEDDADRTAPAGIVMVFAVLPSGLYPVAPVNSTGISPIMEARLHMANVITRGVGLDVGTMTDSLNTIRDSLAAIEAELEAARTDSLDRIRDSINAVLSIPEKLPSQNITVSAPSYTLRYDTINQHIVITNNSQAYRSAGGNIVISSETGKTDIVGNELEINTDNITSFTARTSLNDDISGVIVENDAGQIRRTGALTPFTDSLAVTTITSIDLGYKYKARYKLNCASDPELFTLNLSNPIAGGVYTFRFFGVVDSITVAFSHKQDDETSKVTFGVSDNSSKTFVFDSDGNYFLIPSGTSTTTSTTTVSGYSVLDTLVTSAGWSPASTLLDDYDYISAVIKIESGDGTNGTLGLPTPGATLTDLEFYVQAWDENGTYNPILSGGAGTIWYDSTATNSVTLLNGHTYRLNVDETLAGGYVWIINDLTRDYSSASTTGGIWEQENTSTIATTNTTDNYHQGNIGIGDFSATTIGATIHAYDVTNTRLRLSDSAANDTLAQAYIEYYRGYATNKLGQIGYTDNTDLDLHIENHLTGGGIEFRTDNVEKMKLFADGQLSLPYYGDTIHTGTAVKYLAVTDNGLVIEADASGGATAYTPLGTTDAFGSTGDLAYDDSYLYVKTSTGWQRSALSTWVTNYINIDTMPDLFAWYCADSLALSDGAAVTSWTDLSGNGHHFSQDTVALQPTFNTSDLNGFATITFDGVDDYLFRSDLVWSGGDSIEVYVVVQVADTVTDNYGIMGSFPDKSAFILNIRGSEPDVPAFFMVNSTGSASAYAASGTVSTNWQLINGYYDKTNVGIYYDGTLQDTTAETGAIADDVTKHYIGTYRDNTASRLNGKIAEIIIFSTKHSTARRDMIEAYLGERYNITIN